MFTFRCFSHKAVTLSESPTTSDRKPPLFEDSEKARLLADYASPLPPKWGANYKRLPFVSKVFLLVSGFALVFLSGRAVKYYAPLGYHALLRNYNAHDYGDYTYEVNVDRPISISARPWAGDPVGAQILKRDDWNVKCSSIKNSQNDCKLAFNSDPKSFWQSADNERGHWVEVDLGRKFNVHSLAVKPILKWRSIGGSVWEHRVELASERGSWDLVALGTWRNNELGRRT